MIRLPCMPMYQGAGGCSEGGIIGGGTDQRACGRTTTGMNDDAVGVQVPALPYLRGPPHLLLERPIHLTASPAATTDRSSSPPNH